MVKILYNYARYKFYESQKLNTKTALEIGGFDKVYQFGLNDLPKDIYEKHKALLDAPKGGGYWVYKSVMANVLLNNPEIPEESIIMYSDSGSYFIDSVNHLIQVMDKYNENFMCFTQLHRSRIFTKKETFELTESDTEEFIDTQQYVGGWFLFRKNDLSREFFQKYQEYALDYRIISDAPNSKGQANYSGFLFSLCDESLHSIMCKKYKLYPYRNPSQHGFDDIVRFTKNEYTEESRQRAITEFGEMNTWFEKHGAYTHGESFLLHGGITHDTRSTYPTILHLTRDSR